jgi:hypothetical protein
VLNGDIYLEIRTSSLINNGLAEANGGTLDLGSVTLTNNGTLAVRNGGTIVFSGTLTGDGTLGGTGEIDGDVVLSADPSTLAFQIGGATQSTEYDYLKIVGTFALAGDLQVSFTNSFQSSITSNEVFTVLSDSQPGGLSGSFLNVANGGRLETSDGYGSFLVNYGPSAANSDEIVLSDFVATVPEPTSGALVLAAASLSLLRRRRPSA